MKNQRYGKRIGMICLMAILFVMTGATSFGLISLGQAAPVSNPIGGKTVEMMVPFGPGGSFDVTCRLAAPFLEKALKKITGVDQTVIVVNKPGAAGRTALVEVYKKDANAPVFVLMSASALPQQVGMQTIYDVAKFTYLGRASVDFRAIYIRKDLPINTFKELVDRSQKKPFLIGTSGFGASEHQNTLMMANILRKEANIDLRFDYVHFKGVGEIQAAMMRKDVEGSINSLPDTLMVVRNDYGKVIVQMAPNRVKELLPDVPTLIESGVSGGISAKVQNVLMQKRSYVASPEMNPALADVLRKAIKEALYDPELLAKAKKTDISIDYADPATDLQNSKDTLKAMDEFKDLLAQMYK
ncbi:MAG: tripartite tricarboxylate transporter substrate-binding protein [Thermodesulfobacteriota bacterium]|nr:tripartite tricarboxylate transporter substrate-binding protein [Thermodesulfobacteriota bacterium]